MFSIKKRGAYRYKYALQLLDNIRCRIKKKALNNFLDEVKVTPFLQPIFHKNGITLIGCEVLLRIKKNGQYLSPLSCIHDLELNGLMNDITCFLLEEVSFSFNKRKDELPVGFYFSFNIYPPQLLSEKMTRAISSFNRIFKERASLVIELVERGEPYCDGMFDIINSLKSEGVQFAIDDFGSGVTSLKYIENMGFSILKIDRSLTISNNGRLIYKDVIDAIISLAKLKGLSVTAEGIESQEQMNLLDKAGVNDMQGFYLAKPMSMGDFIGLHLSNH